MTTRNRKTAHAHDIADYKTRLEMQREDLFDLIIEDQSPLGEGPYRGEVIEHEVIKGGLISAYIRIATMDDYKIPKNCVKRFNEAQNKLLATSHVMAISKFNTTDPSSQEESESTAINYNGKFVDVYFSEGGTPKQGGKVRGASFEIVQDKAVGERGCYEYEGMGDSGVFGNLSMSGLFSMALQHGGAAWNNMMWKVGDPIPETPVPGKTNEWKKPIYRLTPKQAASPPPTNVAIVTPADDKGIPANLKFPNAAFVGNPSTSYVTSVQGKRRNPNNGKMGGHGGVDIDVGPHLGTLYSIFDGEVIDSRGTSIDGTSVGGFGAWVRIKHKNVKALDGSESTLISVYGHVGGSYVKKGDQVKKGQAIAAQGNEGKSSGTHLHMNLYVVEGGKYVRIDPLGNLMWPNKRGSVSKWKFANQSTNT